MRARARVELVRRGGVDVVIDQRSDPPLSIRWTPDRVLVVGSAAAPLGGDDLELDVAVGAGATLALGTAAATMVWPGADGDWSRQTTTVRVDDGATLDWRPEPVVSVAGSRHRSHTTIELVGAARLVALEEVSLGRSGEPCGRVDLDLRVVRDGVPLVHHGERLGRGVPGWGSAAHVGAARHVITGVVVGRPAGSSRCCVDAGVTSAWLPVAPDAAVLIVTAPDRPTALAHLPL